MYALRVLLSFVFFFYFLIYTVSIILLLLIPPLIPQYIQLSKYAMSRSRSKCSERANRNYGKVAIIKLLHVFFKIGNQKHNKRTPLSF